MKIVFVGTLMLAPFSAAWGIDHGSKIARKLAEKRVSADKGITREQNREEAAFDKAPDVEEFISDDNAQPKPATDAPAQSPSTTARGVSAGKGTTGKQNRDEAADDIAPGGVEEFISDDNAQPKPATDAPAQSPCTTVQPAKTIVTNLYVATIATLWALRFLRRRKNAPNGPG